MLDYIRGRLRDIGPNFAILDVAGLGFRCFISLNTYNKIKLLKNSKVLLFTCLHVKEEGAELFGFSELHEREAFILLNKVSGVGPRVALSILSWLEPKRLKSVIMSEDVKTLTSVPGIGNKTAQKIIFELKDKIKNLPVETVSQTEQAALCEARDALLALGFSIGEVQRVLNEIGTATTVEEIISNALRLIAR
ncbi:Holliday junction branch migration protein RuvA [Thermosediminibacter oceani]|uniref:Holliday junction branch migration complex subunit RuvA n=1 Tax=Thermosediminibacter oceani (strain ATCC BAA-1034 / DSM 16646 / JW/IW-1228P) TaxID=555079 RepID=D9RXR2_THEOJ|nr:Holliday junction branch migration protein RuvA [Thermosediminibacter oceani]ADL08136.1 Holliday junction DNA helicase RuvA [Thermosediminibacter oceani DSM 16646]